MKRIRLVQIVTKLELGGAQKHVLHIVAGLPREKYEIVLISSSDGMLNDEALRIPDISFFQIKELQSRINPVKDIYAFLKIRKLLKSLRPDIVHTHSSKAGIIGRLAAYSTGVTKILHTVHGYAFHDFQPLLLKRFYILMEKFVSRFTTKIIFVCKNDINLSKRYKISDPEKNILIYCGINKKNFKSVLSKPNAKEILGFEAETFLVGTIACHKRQKGLINVIMAAKYINNKKVEFILVGDGTEKKHLEKFVKKNDLTDYFIFLGWQKKVKELLNAFDILVLPSLWEGLPMVFLEAMSAGLPIVATNVGGSSEIIINGENGFLCPPGDPCALSQKIITLIEDDTLRKRMATNSLNMIENKRDFNKNYMLDRIDKLYDSLICS